MGRLAYGEIAHRSMRAPQRAIAARHAVVAGLQRLRRLVQRTAGVAHIRARARLETMRPHFAREAFRIGQIANGVAQGFPRQQVGAVIGVDQRADYLFNALGPGRPLPKRHLVPLPYSPDATATTTARRCCASRPAAAKACPCPRAPA